MAAVGPEPPRVGFVGAGRMAEAIAQGLVRAGKVDAQRVLASAPTDKNLCRFRVLGCQTTHSNQEVLQSCSLVIFATKPHVLPAVLEEVAPLVTAEHIIVSVAAGVPLSTLEEVCAFLEALADGAVKMGMPSGLAHRIAAQTLLGTAKMLLQRGQHPAQLRTDVCTPGGTTIYGLHAMEQGGLRAAAMSAVEAATRRAKELNKK